MGLLSHPAPAKSTLRGCENQGLSLPGWVYQSPGGAPMVWYHVWLPQPQPSFALPLTILPLNISYMHPSLPSLLPLPPI